MPHPGSQGDLRGECGATQRSIILPPGLWGQDRQWHPSMGCAGVRKAVWDGIWYSGLPGP